MTCVCVLHTCIYNTFIMQTYYEYYMSNQVGFEGVKYADVIKAQVAI